MQILGFLLNIVALVGAIIVIIDAFKSAVWKGIVALICGLYWLYYAFAEFQHPKKWPIVIGTIILAVAGYGINMASVASSLGR
ncbi:MAG: hypothetical protein AB7F50_01800 [Fimbriimonadaceae bacterium]